VERHGGPVYRGYINNADSNGVKIFYAEEKSHRGKFMKKTLALFCLGAVLFCVSCGKKTEQSGSVTEFSGSFVERGRPVADLANYRIAYYEPVDGESAAGGGFNIQESDEPLVVADFGPQDQLPHEVKKPSIYVVFSQPVVPLAKLGEPIRKSALLAIDPPLEGVYRWYGTRLLSFEPDAESLPQRRYTITVSDKITSLGGKNLQGERSFSFETERLSVLDWELGDGERWVRYGNVHPEDAKQIRLIFSYPVNLEEIAKWIEVRAAGKTWPFKLERFPKIDEKHYRKEQGVVVRVNDKFPLDTDVVIALKQGARSEPGWLGTKEENTWNFHTLLPFKFDNVSVRNYSSPQTKDGDSIPISLEFSQDVEPNGAEKYFSVTGFPALKKDNVHVYGSSVVINNLPLEYQKKYTVRISSELKDLYGRALGKTENVEAEVEEANSYVYIRNSRSRMLEAGYPPKIIWEAQNPVSIRNWIAPAQSPYEKIPLSQLTAMDLSKLPKNSKHFFIEDISPFLNAAGKGSAALRWEYQTKSSWDRGRVYTSDEWLTVQVTNIGITLRYGYNMVLVWATHLSDGTPAANADVELMESGKVVLSGKTDAQGLAVFKFSNGDFVSRFTEPQGNYWNESALGKGFRVRVTEGSGATQDRAEFLPNDSHNHWRFSVSEYVSPFDAEKERPVIYLFTDRGLYRPGETVTFRGIDRSLFVGQFTAYQGPYKIEVSSGAYKAPVITTFEGNTTANGGSFGSFTLPANIDPGQYRIIYRRAVRTGSKQEERVTETSVSFIVANFERLRFESSLRFIEPVVYQGERLSASLSASWLAGGGLSGAPYTWYLTREPAFVVPGGEEGSWRYWNFGPESDGERSFVSRGEGTLGPDGKAGISGETGVDGIEGAAYRYSFEASVQDTARQEISARASILVHPASFYIAARLDSGNIKTAATGGTVTAASTSSASFLSAGQPATLSWALVSPNGDGMRDQSGDLSIQLVRHEWKQARQQGTGGRVNLVWERVEEIAGQRNVKIAPSSGTISGVFNFTPDKSGLWEIRLSSHDQKKRAAATRFRFYVSGAGWVRWGSDDVDAITLSPDRMSYAPGETAKIMVRSPLEKGKYLLTLERENVISQKIIELKGSALTIDIPIEESYVPVVYAALSSYTVRSGPPQNSYYEPDLDKPKGVFGVTPIFIDNESRHYQIEIDTGRNTYRPAEQAEVKIKVLLNGRPAANTEVSFLAVDRGVVDLIDYHVPDPLAYFYSPWNFPLGVRGADSRSLLIDPVTYSLSDLQGGDSDDEGKGGDGADRFSADMKERKDWRPTAVFEPYLVTGPDGTVTVKFNLPDSLTSYRCTAVAASVNNFGIKENDLRVSAPLTAIAALPRKLRWRDTGSVSLILTNLENTAVEASVSLKTSSESTAGNDTIIEVDGEDSKTVRVLPGASQEVSFKVAAIGAGVARLTFTLRSPEVNERILKTLLVDRPNLTETVTTIGNLGSENSFIEEGMILPSLVPEGTGNVTVSLSSSRLATLKEAVRYLLDYPYGCLEQRTARLLPIVAFGEYLDTFDLDTPLAAFGEYLDTFDLASPLRGFSPWNPKNIVEKELADIAKYQLADGSFPYWPGGWRGDLFISARVAHIVALAKAKKMKVPDSLDTRRLLSYIGTASNEDRFKDPFVKGYSLWIRTMYGERIGSEISAFLKRGDELGISGWAFAGLAALEMGQKDLASSARDRVRRFIRPGTRSLDLTDTYERQGNYWGYDSDRYALALMLFSSLNPQGDDMTTRLATSLIERQRRGVWGNTASSFWAVLAFGMIGDTESSEWKTADGAPFTTPPLLAATTLGGMQLFNAEFKTYGGVPVSYNGRFTEMPILNLQRDTLLPLRIERSGPGRLYYTASLRYGIPVELAGARDEGLGVFVETYDSDGNPVKSSRLIPGKTYTRRVTVSSSRDRTFVALRSPIPSGAEIVDAVFVTSSTLPPSQKDEDDDYDWRYYKEPPVSFMMDDEARFHWDFFKAGREQIEFRFRAVMPGIYPTPPSVAECMYEEEVFGRSAGELIRIE
jgi:uncharacterized protein YfaS (alpha-2-macroglobulin family)